MLGALLRGAAGDGRRRGRLARSSISRMRGRAPNKSRNYRSGVGTGRDPGGSRRRAALGRASHLERRMRGSRRRKYILGIEAGPPWICRGPAPAVALTRNQTCDHVRASKMPASCRSFRTR